MSPAFSSSIRSGGHTALWVSPHRPQGTLRSYRSPSKVTRRALPPQEQATSALEASRANTDRAAITVLPHLGQR